MKKVLLFGYCLLLAWGALGQQQTISGKVSDSADGSSLPGVSVLLKGTAIGTTTDSNGSYSIKAGPDDVLVFSFIGYESQEVVVGQRTSIDIPLVASISELSEVVVIGYGERDKKALTGSVAAVNSKDIEKSIQVAPEMAMQGRMAGVFVSSPGGSPSARPTVRIRGVGTFNNATPLYVVDGIPLFEFGENSSNNDGVINDVRGTVNILSLINPNDIESISVLKDASAAAVYGVRAANGVVLITTKKGKGKPKVEVNSSIGFQNFTKGKIKMLNTSQYTDLYTEAYQNDFLYHTQQLPSPDPGYTNKIGAQFIPGNPLYLGNSPTYDWQGALANKNAAMSNYNVKVSGSNDNTSYYLSGGFSRTQSPMVGEDFKRYSLAMNVSSKISKYVETGITYRLGVVDNPVTVSTNMGYVASAPPWQPIYDPNDPTGYAPTVSNTFVPNPDFDLTKADPGPKYNFGSAEPNRLWGIQSSSNVFANQKLTQTKNPVIRNMGNAYVQVEPLPGLKFKGSLSMDWSQQQRKQWFDLDGWRFSETPNNPYAGQDGNAVGSYEIRTARTLNVTKEFAVMYGKSFGDHNFDVLLNASDQNIKWDFNSLSSPINFNEAPLRNVQEVKQFNNSGSLTSEYALQGYLGRLSYNYAGKYYVDATVRRDGSSNFAPGYRWGTFPALSAAWRISQENFFHVPFVNDLKIRSGYGVLGNQNVNNTIGLTDFPYQSPVNLGGSYNLGSGNGSANGTQAFASFLSRFPTKNLSWEKAYSFTLAADAMLFNKLSVTAEYYDRRTKSILQRVSLPGNSGIQEQIYLNVGDVSNRGFELTLDYKENIGDVQVNIGGNITTVRNRVISLYQGQAFGSDGSRIAEGYSINYIRGYKVGGIFQTPEEVTAWRSNFTDQSGAAYQPGDMWFKDLYGTPTEANKVNKTPDGKVDGNDRAYLGKTIPGYYYGVNLGANWKGFDLSIFFQGVGDVQKVNYLRMGGESMSSTGDNQWATTTGRWTPTHHSTTMPRAIAGDPAGATRFSDRWVENAGFVRLKNVQLGYTIPSAVLAKTKAISSVRIYVAGTNMYTWTKWTGLDPENDIIPPAKTYNVGINATF